MVVLNRKYPGVEVGVGVGIAICGDNSSSLQKDCGTVCFSMCSIFSIPSPSSSGSTVVGVVVVVCWDYASKN